MTSPAPPLDGEQGADVPPQAQHGFVTVTPERPEPGQHRRSWSARPSPARVGHGSTPPDEPPCPYYSSAYEEKIRQCVQTLPCSDWAYPYSKFVVNGHTDNVDNYWRRGWL